MGEPYGWVDAIEPGSYQATSHVSFQHALLLAADAAHKEHPGAPATVTFALTLGSNPPINEYKVTVSVQ